MMFRKILLLTILSLISFFNSKPLDNYQIKSPDGRVDLKISLENSKVIYQLNWNGKEMIKKSEVSIFPNAQIKILSTKTIENNKVWEPIWEQFSSIRDNYKEIRFEIETNKVKGKLFARVYNEGIAFRLQLDKGAKPNETQYLFSANFSETDLYYASNEENEPVGPVSLKELETYQFSTKDKTKKSVPVPLVVETKDHNFMALLESDLFAAKGMESMQIDTDIAHKKIVSINKIKLSQEEFISPWRVILLGKSAGDLVVNTTIQNLATPCQLENTDWIKPGKTVWDWRVHGHIASDGFKYGIDTESYLRFIDFASKNEIEYFMIDADWFKKVTPGHFEVSDKLDLEKIIKYGNTKKVDVILYYDNQKGKYGDEKLFSYFQSLGVQGIKYGFMGNNVPFTKEAIRLSAQSKLLIDFHDGPVPFAGIHRTYPNAITREYCHAQQDSRRAFTPEAFIKMALINAITGPLDMNNGNFNLIEINSGKRLKGPVKVNSYLSTVASEAARTLIIFSGLVCIPDAPDAYEAKKDLFEFISKLPVGKWDDTRIFNAKIGESITTARRYGKEWFVGSVINQKGGTLNIKLDFLEPNQLYDVTYYEDTNETDCKTNPEAYQVRKGIVKKGDFIHAKLAPGGGHCMWIRPVTIDKKN